MTNLRCDCIVIPALQAIRVCVAEQLALCDRMVCRFPITWNEKQPPADACDCTCGGGNGQAWIRWVDTKQGKSGGKGMAAAGCAVAGYDVTLEVGIYRCWPVPGDAKPLPTWEEEEAALGLLVDAAAIRRGLQCCDYLEDISWELTRQQPTGHSGGCTGVSAELTMHVTDSGCGEPSSMPPAQRAQALSSLGVAA